MSRILSEATPLDFMAGLRLVFPLFYFYQIFGTVTYMNSYEDSFELICRQTCSNFVIPLLHVECKGFCNDLNEQVKICLCISELFL